MATAAPAGASTGLKPSQAAEAGRSAGPEVSTFTLNNGLQVVVIPDRRTPVVTHMIWYKVGSADEARGVSGIAHFLEHLMFKGTAKNPAGAFSHAVAELGGQENAFTSYDYTAYFQRVAREHLQTVMAFEADRMEGLQLTDDVVDPERDVILEERRSRVDGDPSAQLGEAVAASLFVNHPYGTPIIGWEHEIEKLDRHDAIAFYDRFYTPNNAILVVAGDVSPEDVREAAEETYGRIARRADPGPRARPREPEPRAARRVELADPRVNQPAIQRNWLAPSYETAKGDRAYALDLLAQILGGGVTARVYKSLVVDKGIAANAGSWYHGDALDDGRFAIYATPRAGVPLSELEAAIDEVIAEIAADGPAAGELDRAKTRLVADTIYAQDSQATLARIYGASLATGGTIDEVQEWPSRIRAVTAEAVRDAAREVLDRRRSVTGELLPAAA
ncbi:M16 family metallopeptidase [Hansschlegelia quercus]|uniref:Insulinase family protein n=1 Tax=Hansschlegelia quercus TaxID=2528245 RepID=A0A4Q9GT61_9HYPH|nr:pitrilysin family protein [Hansschlegelia quercus]TBN54997.1 insulinase family protein [Hansschlegelia quercus]